MIKDAYEDYKRHKSDKSENESLCQVYNRDSDQFETVQWQQVKVGDIVQVTENTFFPADMLVLNSSEAAGEFHVETKNLDGESNLKLKSVAKHLIEPFC